MAECSLHLDATWSVTLNDERVQRIMRQVPGFDRARLNEWHLEPLAYLSVLPGRELARLSGTAILHTGESMPWSSVLKVFSDSRSREILTYRSGLLAHLPGRLRAPCVYAIEDTADGRVWLWLEDLHDLYARKWLLAQFTSAARDLGVFNGHYLNVGPPAEPWLNQWLHLAWAEQHAEVDRIPSYRADLQRILTLPEVRPYFSSRAAASIMRLLDDQPRFLHWLSQVPQTLCHHDAALANLFAVRGSDGMLQTVAVDWEKLGPGAIGVEIATLTFGTLRRCEFDGSLADELDAAVFDGYMSGLREAGWDGPTQLVRLGYTAAIGLRWTVLDGIIRMLVHGPEPVRNSQGALVPAESVLVQRVHLANFLLDRADEARRLARSWSGFA